VAIVAASRAARPAWPSVRPRAGNRPPDDPSTTAPSTTTASIGTCGTVTSNQSLYTPLTVAAGYDTPLTRVCPARMI
jgi:hypothetical protein